MGIVDRAFVWETQNATLVDRQVAAGVSDASSTDNVNIPILKIFKSIDISFTIETMEATAGGDPNDPTAVWKYPRPKSRDWSVDVNAVMNNALSTAIVPGTATESFNFKDVLDNLSDGQGLFTYTGPLDVAGNPCITITGYVTKASSEINLPDEAGEQSLRLVGYGPPAITLAGS